MKKLNDILILGAFLTGVLSPQLGYSQEKMNSETQDLVISKMERVLSSMDEKNSSWLASQQRLADLLSERARFRFMQEIEANCDGCKGSKADRQKAISIYEGLLKQVKINEHGPIYFQLAHLYEMAGDINKAIEVYENILKGAKKKNIKEAIVTRSRAALGDLYFQKGRFKDAKFLYQVALKDKQLQNRSLTVYNLAWTEYNTDNLNKGIQTLENLLKTPEQITRDTEEGSRYDKAFHLDITKDLATFYTKRDISARDIKTFESVVPADSRKASLLSFAKEADRTGQKKAAHQILVRYMQDATLTDSERIEASVLMAQINYDRGQNGQSIEQFAIAAKKIQDNGCGKREQCEEMQKQMKRYVTELHRSKKINPDKDLLKAYQLYVATFPLDMDMIQRGAQVATDLNDYVTAVALYRTISDSKKFTSQQRHQAMTNEVAVAEKSKNPELQRGAYLYYLRYADKNAKYWEVQYQLGYLAYQQQKFADAAEVFEDVAKNKDVNNGLRKKAADLSLDALAKLKKDENLEVLAWDYVVIFKKDQKEFSTIARKSLMNRVAAVTNNPASTPSDLKKALSDLDEKKLQLATSEERILFYTNKSVVALKLNDEAAYLSSSRSLLATKGLTAQQREETLERLTGYFEQRLDFRNAYQTALQLKSPKMPKKEKEFRLGTLADLAGANAIKHYRNAIDAGLRGSRELVIRSRMVELAKNPAGELKNQSRYLKVKPALLNEMTLVVYAKTGNEKSLRPVLNMKEMRKQSAGNFIAKQSFYRKMQNESSKISAHQINTKSDRLMQKSLASRVEMLKKADRFLNESLKLNDVTSQMLALELVSKENERMVRDLAALPVPAGLTPKEVEQYLGILKNQSRPYLMKARVAQQQQAAIWNGSRALQNTLRDYQNARVELRPLINRELQVLTQVSGEGPMKTAAVDVLNSRQFSSGDLSSARQSVANNPVSKADIENLKNIETKIGHPLMPSYLEARLSHLQGGKSL